MGAKQSLRSALLHLVPFVLVIATVVALPMGDSGSSSAATTKPKPSSQVPTTSSKSKPKTSTTSPRRRQTTTTLSPIALAGQYYLWVVGPSNCAGQQLNAAIARAANYPDNPESGGAKGNADRWTYMQREYFPFVVKYRDAELAFATALGVFAWPDSVRAYVNEFVSVILQNARVADDEARVQSLEEWSAFWSDSRNVEVSALLKRSSSLAAEIRARLGLPSNIGATGSSC